MNAADELRNAARSLIEQTEGSDALLDQQLNLTARQLLERLDMVEECYG